MCARILFVRTRWLQKILCMHDRTHCLNQEASTHTLNTLKEPFKHTKNTMVVCCNQTRKSLRTRRMILTVCLSHGELEPCQTFQGSAWPPLCVRLEDDADCRGGSEAGLECEFEVGRVSDGHHQVVPCELLIVEGVVDVHAHAEGVGCDGENVAEGSDIGSEDASAAILGIPDRNDGVGVRSLTNDLDHINPVGAALLLDLDGNKVIRVVLLSAVGGKVQANFEERKVLSGHGPSPGEQHRAAHVVGGSVLSACNTVSNHEVAVEAVSVAGDLVDVVLRDGLRGLRHQSVDEGVVGCGAVNDVDSSEGNGSGSSRRVAYVQRHSVVPSTVLAVVGCVEELGDCEVAGVIEFLGEDHVTHHGLLLLLFLRLIKLVGSEEVQAKLSEIKLSEVEVKALGASQVVRSKLLDVEGALSNTDSNSTEQRELHL
mmetsp:Transcript_8547/g.16762  ORF Transcript_8547/g.16762 Transcript_8547/m.16762 type:complete len:428 (+) Transcript_8547:486-1769(+)